MKSLESMIQRIKDPKKRKILVDKMNQLNQIKKQKSKGGNGMLQDNFKYNAKGHIKVDRIDSEGNVIENLVDKDNLVVDKADEIVLRALSGDTGRSIYKNRVPKGGSQEVFISESKLNGKDIMENGKVIHDPSVLWSEANDEMFDVSYAYYPNTVYIAPLATDKPNKKAFTVYTSAGANRTPMSAEMYSSYSNLFIGLGEGLGRNLDFEKLEINKTNEADLKVEKELITLLKEEAAIEYSVRAGRSDIFFEESKTGGTVNILVNDELKATVETGNKTLDKPRVKSYAIKDLDPEKTSKIKIVHKGSDIEVGKPIVKITKLLADTLVKKLNEMMGEFGNYRTVFDTDIFVNTSPEAPYVAKVPHHPVKADTLKVVYQNVNLNPSKTKEDLKDYEYHYDEVLGELHFGQAMTGISLRYEITGEVAEEFDEKTITTTEITNVDKVPVDIVDETIQIPSGVNPTYSLKKKNIIEGSLTLKLNGADVKDSEILNLDLEQGTFRLSQSAAGTIQGATLEASFTYNNLVESDVKVLKIKLDKELDPEKEIKVVTGKGAALKKAEKEKEMTFGKYFFYEEDLKTLYVSVLEKEFDDPNEEAIEKVYVKYFSDEFKGFETGYKRSLIQKPKEEGKYPWFQYDTGSIKFVAQFKEDEIKENITIREMGLFDGPRVADEFEGFPGYPVKAFSLVRIPETVKAVSTGIEVSWVITFYNEEGNHYKGGDN